MHVTRERVRERRCDSGSDSALSTLAVLVEE